MCNLTTLPPLHISTTLLDILLTPLNSDKSNKLCSQQSLLLISFHISVLIDSTGPVLLMTFGSIMLKFSGKIGINVHLDCSSRLPSVLMVAESCVANDSSIIWEHRRDFGPESVI